jgi:hypothetical protein
MQRESAPPQPKSPEVLAVEQRLREQAQQPINFGKFAFHSGSAILMVGAYARLKVFMASLPEPENNVS